MATTHYGAPFGRAFSIPHKLATLTLFERYCKVTLVTAEERAMLPTDTFPQRFIRIMSIQMLWAMRIGMVVLWFASLYVLIFAREYIVIPIEPPFAPHEIPAILVVAALFGAPFALWQLRDVKF